MKSRLSLVGVLLRKDLRLFGSFAFLMAGLLAVRQFPDVVTQLGPVSGLVQIGVQLGVVLLILVVCHEDAVVSLRHDWLTRPIPGLALLSAKALFVMLVVIVPSILGSLTYNLMQGSSLGEALLMAASSGARGDVLTILVVVMAFAAVTANVRQAMVVFLGGIGALLVLMEIWTSLHQVPEPPASTSSGWVVTLGMQLLLTFAAVAILWVQYRHRHTKASRGIAAAAAIGGTVLVMFVTWKPVFAIQKMLATDPEAAKQVQVDLATGCFPSRLLDASTGTAIAATQLPTAQRYSEEHRENAGPGATAFSTQLRIEHMPAGGVLAVDHVRLSYVSAGQEQHLRPGMASSRWMVGTGDRSVANHFWLLPEADAGRLTSLPTIETRLDYALSLLAPKHVAHLVAGGQRSYYAGIGWCSARTDGAANSVAVDCFKPGAQPAFLTANLEGAPEAAAVAGGRVDFTPALLDFWGGRSHTMRLAASGATPPRVTVTAYEARAHFDRQIVVPGVLGGPASACPVPTLP